MSRPPSWLLSGISQRPGISYASLSPTEQLPPKLDSIQKTSSQSLNRLLGQVTRCESSIASATRTAIEIVAVQRPFIPWRSSIPTLSQSSWPFTIRVMAIFVHFHSVFLGLETIAPILKFRLSTAPASVGLFTLLVVCVFLVCEINPIGLGLRRRITWGRVVGRSFWESRGGAESQVHAEEAPIGLD